MLVALLAGPSLLEAGPVVFSVTSTGLLRQQQRSTGGVGILLKGGAKVVGESEAGPVISARHRV